MRNLRFFGFIVLVVFTSLTALAQVHGPTHQIKVLPTRFDTHIIGAPIGSPPPQNAQEITTIVGHYFNPMQFREIHAQLLRSPVTGQPDRILVYLLRIGFHQVRSAAIYVDANLNVKNVQMDYRIQRSDVLQQPGHDHLAVQCPDPSVQFIAFAPNDDDLEQQVTVQVGNFAQGKGLKTMMLLKDKATRQNYLDYMSCPSLVGNFYDGDANPSLITTVDGSISSDEIANLLKGAFRFKVTNIWLACQAYNDPMLTAMVKTSASQKYYAGINNLAVGPSDRAAACTMQGALSGVAISTSFDSCYKQFDTADDHWGAGGTGSDFLGR